MRNRAKTYYQFITEAHIDSSGELQDFDPSMDDSYDSYLVDDAIDFSDFLEEEGATGIKISINDPYFTITFDYGYQIYSIRVDPEKEKIWITSNDVEVYTDSISNFTSLVNAEGLRFLKAEDF